MAPHAMGSVMGFLRRHKFISGFVAIALLYWIAPYATTAFDDPADKQQNKCSKDGPLLTERPGYFGKVLKIRLTNDGKFVDRCELTDVLYELNWDMPLHPNEFRPNPKPDAKPLPKFVVLYIHGWKHSASEDDGDVQSFTSLIDRLASSNPDQKQVLGVYIGWNAASKLPPFNWSPFDNLTFWSKQAIADGIAQSAVTTKIISSIGSVMSRGDNAEANQFIAIGHSFGARLLFSATNQPLIYDTAKAHPGFPGGVYRKIQGMANAVILLNPAFEAARYTALDAVTRFDEDFASDQLPLLLSVSTDGDWATKTAFPVGQWLSFDRSETEMITLGNHAKYETHSLQAVGTNGCGSPDANHLSERFVANGLCLSRYKIPHNDGHISQPRNPFLIARTTSDIIKDHNDIWNEKFSGWLFAYIDELGKKERPTLLSLSK
jgi:hypothetical protein